MAERVVIRMPDGAVHNVTRHAFEVVHRPNGAVLEQSHVDTERRLWFLKSNSPGGDRARSLWPSQALADWGWRARATGGWPGQLDERDAVSMHRMLAPEWHPSVAAIVQTYRDFGARVLVDVDDEVERIPIENEKRATPEQLDGLRAAIAAADGLVVTTSRLADVYGETARETWIVPNRIPRWVGQVVSDLPPGDRVRVGWAGKLTTHSQDVAWFAPVARRALVGAQFVTVGSESVPERLGLDPAQCVAEPLCVDPEPFYARMARADVGLVPLDNGVDRLFNESKSSLKAREFLALGKPVVVTDLPEQRALLEGTGAGFLVDTPEQMAEAVQALVHNHALRAEMTDAALALREQLWLERHAHEWLNALLSKGADDGSVRDRSRTRGVPVAP